MKSHLPPSEQLRVFDDIVQTIGRTPLVRLGRLGRDLECGLYAKVESFNPGGSVKDRMLFGAIVSSANACGLWCFAMLWLDRTRLPKPLRMSLLLTLATAIAGVAMMGLGIQSTIEYFRK